MELTRSVKELEQEINTLRSQLEEANDTLEAIRTGQIDALVITRTATSFIHLTRPIKLTAFLLRK